MKSKWNQESAQMLIRQYEKQGISKDLALRVYSCKLLGNDPSLVLHGGGNVSLKTLASDGLKNNQQVICVKGSGWDMGNIEPPGLPSMYLDQLLELRSLTSLVDEDMVTYQRRSLLNPSSPNPSIETLLHAFLPHTYIDHTHATAVLSLTNQKDGEKIISEVYGVRVGIVPYVKPGFDLAVRASEVYVENPEVEGLILLNHGIFTFGGTAKESYERMIELVDLAERYIQGHKKEYTFTSSRLPKKMAAVSEVLPVIRGLLAQNSSETSKTVVLDLRSNPNILNFVNGRDVGQYSQMGVITPDHIIRIKNSPLILPAPQNGHLDAFLKESHQRLKAFKDSYHKYFLENNSKSKAENIELDSTPCVALIPGIGFVGIGSTFKMANVAADLYENNITGISGAEAVGRYETINSKELFEMEYWSLEQAKLAGIKERPLDRKIALITGGGNGIGATTAALMAKSGASVVVVDIDGDEAQKVAQRIGNGSIGLACDVTKNEEVKKVFDITCETFGGVDIVMSNAGKTWQGCIGEVSVEVLKDSFDLNFFAHQFIAQAAVKVMKSQGSGGALLFNLSKQAVNPGNDFGPYGLPKAATLFLMKQYALEYGKYGITSNGVNADRINTNLFTGGLLESRAQARGVSIDEYLEGNLLEREVTKEDVAKAFLHLSLARKTTSGIITVDGGNIAASLR
jgi:rhamnose utilization protein RhaD (predicted bifunctional aldolase and dehydrogenase)/NAD(P)-dependent dehydrogenase (short-subunit alcohol dehydrogenase family)